VREREESKREKEREGGRARKSWREEEQEKKSERERELDHHRHRKAVHKIKIERPESLLSSSHDLLPRSIMGRDPVRPPPGRYRGDS